MFISFEKHCPVGLLLIILLWFSLQVAVQIHHIRIIYDCPSFYST